MNNVEQKNKLPEQWAWTTLGELGVVVSGSTPSTKEPLFWGGDIAWVTPADLSDIKEKYIKSGKRNITQLGLNYSSTVLLPKNSLLFSSRAPIGYVAISQGELSTNQGFKNLIPVSSVNVDYLYYYLQFAKPIAMQMANGTTFLELSAVNFSKIPVSLPPLREQHRIVEKIEELFSRFEKAKEQLEQAQALLKIYKKTILENAFNGKLTGEQLDENGFPKSWERKKISDICTVVRGGSPRPAGDSRYYGGNIPFLKVGDLTKDDSVYLHTHSYSIKEAGLQKTRQIKLNTLLLTNSGATLGVPKICMIDATMNDGIAAFIDLDQRYNLYLYYFWKSKTEELRSLNQGVAQPNLNTIIIKNTEFPYCSFEKQNEIVQEIESRFSLCDKLAEQIIQSLYKVELTEKSILQKAFKGELVEQDLTDEPASVLLSKISKEKELLAKSKSEKKHKYIDIIKSTAMSQEPKDILEVLDEHQEPMAAKDVWISSKYKEDIEEFYENLKVLISEGKVIELPRQGKESFLKVDRNEDR